MNEQIFGVEIISSKTNSTIVKIAKLSSKKYRNEYGMFMCDGVKLLKEAADFGADIKYIIIRNNFKLDFDLETTIKNCQKNGTKILVVNEAVFSKISEENAPQGIISVCSYLDNISNSTIDVNFEKHEKIIALESVRDPGNIGTILRNAAAFGIDRIIMSNDCADVYSQKVIRAAMGAVLKLKIDISSNFIDTIKTLQKAGKNVLGAALDPDSLILGERKISNDDVIIIGNEGHGLSNEVLSAVNDTIFIPIEKNTESLNAAMASAIFMWEISKK